ncbi:MAG: MBL fold metallo-hydrolase [Rhizobiales bacterium]|nr:MBL fold metallo-hydrolase [Hyphomicrobiales bacterium]
MAKISFDRDFEPAYGKAVQVSPLVRRLTCNNPSAFTFTGTGSYIVGTGNVAVIDPGPDDDQHLEAILAAVDGETVSHIIITHTHRDHSPLAARLQALTGAKTYGYGPHGAGRRARAIAAGDVQLDASGDMKFDPDVNVRNGDVIEGTGWRLEALFTPGHCSNHLAFGLPEENALFCGDHVMAWSTSVIAPPDGNMADYFASLDRLMQRSDETYWPGHGPAKQDPLPFVRAFKTHRRMREEAIFKRLKLGDRTIMEVVRAVYADVDQRLHPAAAMSTLAHVEHLIEQERVATDGDLTLSAEYRVK